MHSDSSIFYIPFFESYSEGLFIVFLILMIIILKAVPFSKLTKLSIKDICKIERSCTLVLFRFRWRPTLGCRFCRWAEILSNFATNRIFPPPEEEDSPALRQRRHGPQKAPLPLRLGAQWRRLPRQLLRVTQWTPRQLRQVILQTPRQPRRVIHQTPRQLRHVTQRTARRLRFSNTPSILVRCLLMD